MSHSKLQWWGRFQKYYTEFPEVGLAVDLSRMKISDEFFAKMEPRVQKALADMSALEAGAIANPDENRMVGHYWLRNPALAPTPQIRQEIEETIVRIREFAGKVHAGKIRGNGGKFKNFLLIGIGGSALGPQFVAHALGDPRTDKLKPHFFDNTDPDGMDRVLATIGRALNRTLCIIISKSGGTKETRNGMLVAKAAYETAGLDFGSHAVAITMAGSDLDKYANENKWLTHFPMWDWIGGRTSELSAVGLLPAALQGLDIDSLLSGACEIDKVTRNKNVKANPAAQLSLAWFESGNGNGTKNMVVLPYKDRLELFSKYLQQLLMESLGKELDLNRNVVNQGITVLGNKGSTDQHSYVQQLRDGLDNFFVTFIEVLADGRNSSLMVEKMVTSGDYLHGLYLGTRQALAERDRESLTITVKDVSARTVGMLIALFERAVGLYASLININAYHQPGVEAGKKAAQQIIEIQKMILDYISNKPNMLFTVAEISKVIDKEEDVDTVYKVIQHLASNSHHNLSQSQDCPSLHAKYGLS
ncbi:MAG TPA: glucose-6-phosphate isomerase [Candidatus Sulfopaludibacter sp.]|nr:glucose-6-phosphate isomerase [Candidatus Sulfopaludibacter sp.]